MTAKTDSLVAALIGVLYAVSMGLRGDILPGIVGGVLAASLALLVLRRVRGGRPGA